MKNYKIIIFATLCGVIFTTVVFSQLKINKRNIYDIDATRQELLNIATTALDTELNLSVYNADQVASKGDPRFEEAMKQNFSAASASKELAKSKEIYASDPVSILSKERYTIEDNSAILILIQHKKIRNTTSTGESVQQEEIIEHQFEFSHKNGSWILEKDTRLSAPELQMTDKDMGFSGKDDKGTSEDVFFNRKEFINNIATSSEADRNAIVSYAYMYWQYPNPNYVLYGNDCTNFTSQALYYGGWQMIPGDYRNDNVWFYNNIHPSFTWGGANNFKNFVPVSGRAKRVLPTELVAGDILQIQWEYNKPNYHTVVVTRVLNGEVYLTYHSGANGPVLNKRFSELAAGYPNAVWYGWHLNVPNEINITKITPSSIRPGQGTWLTVKGENFSRGMKASVNQWQIADSGVQYESSSSVRVYVVMNTQGTFTLQLTNSAGRYARKNFSVS